MRSCGGKAGTCIAVVGLEVAGAYSNGSLTRVQGSELAKGKSGEPIGLKKWFSGDQYTFFSIKSATSGEHMGYLAFKNSKITTEGADPATIAVT